MLKYCLRLLVEFQDGNCMAFKIHVHPSTVSIRQGDWTCANMWCGRQQNQQNPCCFFSREKKGDHSLYIVISLYLVFEWLTHHWRNWYHQQLKALCPCSHVVWDQTKSQTVIYEAISFSCWVRCIYHKVSCWQGCDYG